MDLMKQQWVFGNIFNVLKITLVSVVCALLLSGCNALLFHPQKTLLRTPADVQIAYSDVALMASDKTRLHAWWLPADGEAQGSILFLHGNAENISTHLASVYWLPKEGYNVLLLDYRGFGHSEGSATVAGSMLDIIAALQWLQKKQQENNLPIFVLGQSIGASLAGYVIGSDSQWSQLLSGVVLDAGFTRYADIAKDIASRHWLTTWLQWPVAISMPNNVDLLDVVANISPVPLLIIQGNNDKVIPPSYGQSLFDAASEPKQILHYEGGHIETFNHVANRQSLIDFLSSAPSLKKSVMSK